MFWHLYAPDQPILEPINGIFLIWMLFLANVDRVIISAFLTRLKYGEEAGWGFRWDDEGEAFAEETWCGIFQVFQFFSRWSLSFPDWVRRGKGVQMRYISGFSRHLPLETAIYLRCRRLYNCVQSHGGATSKQLHASSESVTNGCFSIFPLPNMICGGQQ